MFGGHWVLIQTEGWTAPGRLQQKANSVENHCLPELSDKGSDITLPREQTSFIHQGLSGSRDTSLSDSCCLVTDFLSFSLCVCVWCMCGPSPRQPLLPCSAGSMTSSRTTTPATVRRRPSRCRRGARRSITAEVCWGARWGRAPLNRRITSHRHF